MSRRTPLVALAAAAALVALRRRQSSSGDGPRPALRQRLRRRSGGLPEGTPTYPSRLVDLRGDGDAELAPPATTPTEVTADYYDGGAGTSST